MEEAALCINEAVRGMRIGSKVEVVCVPDHLMANSKAPASQIKSSIQIIYTVDLLEVTKSSDKSAKSTEAADEDQHAIRRELRGIKAAQASQENSDIVALVERDDGFKVFLHPESASAPSYGAVKPKNGDKV